MNAALPPIQGHSAAGKIVLSNPGIGPFVQQVGRALYEKNQLGTFVTTLADRPDASWRRWLTGSLDATLRKRAVTEFPAELVRTRAPRELLRLFAREIDITGGVLTDIVWNWSERGFDGWVASHGLDGATGVYGFEHACRDTFAEARRRGLRCIYDVPAPEAGFAQRVRDQEIAAHPGLDSAYEERLRVTRGRRCQRRREEFEMADLVIANSEFTLSTYREAGFDVSKVRVVPLGAPPVCTDEVLARRGAEAGLRPLRFLSVGSFALHKGAHVLLSAWRLLAPARRAVLQIVGHVNLPPHSFDGLRESVRCEGFVPHAEMTEIYRQADVLVFPSLCDGFGMVVTEALSQGLPVIATTHAGAAQLLTSGQNGWVIAPGDAAALAAVMEWCLTHPAELAQMNRQARETAGRWQWSNFRSKLMGVISARVGV